MDSVVSLRDVRKSYRMGSENLLVLKGINLDIKRGEFISIMGPSGSGKSTLMNLIGLLDRPDSGRLVINERDTGTLNDVELSHLRGKEIGFIFQTFNLVARMTALKNVELPMIFQGKPQAYRSAIAKKYLEEVGLGDRLSHRPNELSGGQRQRVAIARSLVNDPSILLADEPTGNLDAKTGEEIMRLFVDLNKKGRTIVMVTHNPDVAQFSQRIIRLKDGAILEET
ncbi:ABC-type antimicrobial peptide transport system, ATPase component [Methanocella conradii HZ254]|uniref:ABC-type antimicrobial peptide transport system, ATPase component n=1 Tax=Methanocella conradii (strain DSM 24694 / JCM 17849 / CGMCC 1.5162 / HZ254) TaxID=1041930 RepID=H8I5L3_METCZ|nr:ABC transporter ATP-binding protein [Methanocella conradii]AFC99332.1 ABC-type antimicrobial peptide transport system, ATPase component [Methanocella conradii HZ254]